MSLKFFLDMPPLTCKKSLRLSMLFYIDVGYEAQEAGLEVKPDI